jgi:hypothetical protein
MGWLVAALGWAEHVLEPWGTVGYTVTILVIVNLILSAIAIAVYCFERVWLARSARSERFRNAVSYVLVIGVWLVGSAVFGAFVVWIWHVLMPTPWRWLAPDEITKLEIIFFSGSISALATAGMKTIFAKNKMRASALIAPSNPSIAARRRPSRPSSLPGA